MTELEIRTATVTETRARAPGPKLPGTHPAEIGAFGSGLVPPENLAPAPSGENFLRRTKRYRRYSAVDDKLALTFLNFILVAVVFDPLKSF